jgi:hypothetical protein
MPAPRPQQILPRRPYGAPLCAAARYNMQRGPRQAGEEHAPKPKSPKLKREFYASQRALKLVGKIYDCFFIGVHSPPRRPLLRPSPPVPRERKCRCPTPVLLQAHDACQKWAARCTLSLEPEMPEGFIGRRADNWRPLLSIADDFGRGEEARAAAAKLGSSRQWENPRITLLNDIKTVFNMYSADRLITKTELIPGLERLEESLWAGWTGENDAGAPHLITQGDLGRMLKHFGIRSKNIWPPQRGAESKCESGYYRNQFEKATNSLQLMGEGVPHEHSQSSGPAKK